MRTLRMIGLQEDGGYVTIEDIIKKEETLMQPMVSICVLAYNHEKYLRRALDSFLMQKTDFPFEIVINDDASTDGTAEIIREYERNYPDILRPLYHTENQYSRGIRNISAAFNYPRARGTYIAFCEGDDYWTNDKKLQIQVEYMEAHPECALCVHAAESVSENGDFLEEIRPYSDTRVVSAEEVVLERICYPSASMLFRTCYVKELPGYYHDAPVGDIPLHLHLATKGTVWYLNEVYSAYRQGSVASWNRELHGGDREKRIAKAEEHCRAMTKMYTDFDELTSHRYHSEVETMIRRQELFCLMVREDYRALMSRENREFVEREYSRKDVRYFRIRSLMPDAVFYFLRRFLPGEVVK